MANLKAYAWEHNHYSDEQKIDIPYPERKFLPHIIAKNFNIHNLTLAFNMRKPNSGLAHTGSWHPHIQLPKPSLPCSLGVIYHEIAHVVNDRHFKSAKNYHKGHLGSFRTALIKVYAEARHFRADARSQAVCEVLAWRQERENQALKANRALEQKAKLKAMRKTPEYKIAQLKKRIKKLETRAKRINTLLKSAKRSLASRERHLAKRQPIEVVAG